MQEKPKKKRGCAPLLVVLVLIVVLVAMASVTILGEVKAGTSGADVTVSIAQGSGVASISKQLADAGVIRFPQVFRLYVKQSGKASQLQYGDFTLHKGMGYDALIDALSQYAAADTVTLTFPEGTPALGIAQAMEDAGLCSAEEFLACANGEDGSDFSQYDFWNRIPDNENRFMKCEGYLFPETYEFYKDDTVYNYVNTFYSEFDRRVDGELLDKVDASGMSLEDVVILASFVQEEAGNEEDRNVAEVFLNRLAEGSPYPRLESNASSYVQDPNDNNYLYNWVAPYYGGWENLPEGLYNAYNTYSCEGLPAGPISNPGLAAMEAVVDPNTELVGEQGGSPCYFFVTDLSGKYYYASTFEEHQANVRTAQSVNQKLGG